MKLVAAILAFLAFGPFVSASQAVPLTVEMTDAYGPEMMVTFDGTYPGCEFTCTRDYPVGSVVKLFAFGRLDRKFLYWSGGACSGTDGACTVTVNGPMTVRANFEVKLQVVTGGDAPGSVTSSPAGVECTGMSVLCNYYFDPGTTLTLIGTPTLEGRFREWGVGCTGYDAQCTLTLDKDIAVRGYFETVRTLTVTKAGTGAGQVTSKPADVDCGSACVAQFKINTPVELFADPTVDTRFTGWSGACSGTAGCTVVMDQHRTVTANYEHVNGPVLSVAKLGTGTGKVTSSPAGIDCGRTCAQAFTAQTQVTLSATPGVGASFTGWSGGGCTGTADCVVTMDQARTVTPTFAAGNTVTVVKTGAGDGRVAAFNTSLDCGAQCIAQIGLGQQISIRAELEPGSRLDHWSGCDYVGLNQNCVVTVNSARTVTAHFAHAPKLRVTPFGGGSHGTITLDPGGKVCEIGAPCEAEFEPGEQVKLTAAPFTGTRFAGWIGGGCTFALTCTVTLDDDLDIDAVFVDTHAVTVTRSGSGSGTVRALPAGIDCGESCTGATNHARTETLTAIPSAGSTFAGWSGGGCSGTGPCSLTVLADTNVTAVFVADTSAPLPSASAPPTPPSAAPARKPGVTVTGKRHGKRATLSLRLRGLPASSARTTVVVDLLKGAKRIASGSARVTSGRARLTLRAKRTIAPGRYRLRVRIRQGMKTTTLAPVLLRLR